MPGRSYQFQRIAPGRRLGRWSIAAFYLVEEGPGGVNQAYPIEDCITFDLLQLSDARLRVQAKSANGPAENYLADLVKRICRDYPEAATPEPGPADVTGSPAASAPDPAAGDVRETAGAVDLPPVTDEIDQFILKLVTADPDLKDELVAARLPYKNKDGLDFSRQAINERRKKLKAMGYTVR